ncbi:DUF1836 domain-containing protein [Xylocopilactobacillus apis]|uniref:DUF1836 domain-containing protein n=1 Tax=Xylocopilactobacillus apis TaxID=2932183 RepID=A0AAU9DSA3_9LACO|nr:DUF1836 domain-containing protein [Xylocopilactobacillus apis]BDR56553.1 hypothetical protein KIMC2_11150 [Xylocopilactobacillus apis]
MSLPTWDELPNFDLYMDQIVTVVNDSTNPWGGEITSSMVNNYVKHKLLDSPQKKKYNRVHVAQLIFINLMKEIFSLDEIISLKEQFLVDSKIEDRYNGFIKIFNEQLVNSSDDVNDNLSDIFGQLSSVLIAKRQIKNLLQEPDLDS